NQMAVRASLIVLERAGHIERGNAAENLATLIPRKDLTAYLDQQTRETQASTALGAIVGRYNPQLNKSSQISIAALASDSGLNRHQIVTSIGKLQELGLLEYQPSFRGRGIRMVD